MLSPLDLALIGAMRLLSPGELEEALEQDVLPLAGPPEERQAVLDRIEYLRTLRGRDQLGRVMCNRYVSPGQADIERFFEIGRRNPVMPWPAELYPRAPGPFVRLDREGRRELLVGRWGLIPHFAKSPDIRYSTNNARSEELAEKPTYRTPWARGQRCVIPAASFDEPNWETGKNVWWRFRRADGEPWGLAGLWNAWIDWATGEIHESAYFSPS